MDGSKVNEMTNSLSLKISNDEIREMRGGGEIYIEQKVHGRRSDALVQKQGQLARATCTGI